jgi:hypothetical protein
VKISLGVALAIRRPSALSEAATAAAGSSRGAPHLSVGQFASIYGPTERAVREVSAALRSLGLRPSPPSQNHLLIPVRATVGQITRAFGARLDAVRLRTGSTGWAPESVPLLPSSVAPEVSAIFGLSNLAVPHDQLGPRSVPTKTEPPVARLVKRSSSIPKACAAAKSVAASSGGWSDDQVAKAYGLDHLFARGVTAVGQTIALFELEPFALSDVATFDRCYFGRSHTDQIAVETIDGFDQTGQGNGEAVLDVENLSALAPSAKIDVYEAPNTSFGAIDEYNAIISEDRANIISTSWGECEAALDAGAPGARALENTLFEEAALQGETVVAASGDDGSDDCANTPFSSSVAVKPYLSVDDPASQPYVLGVGGTTLDSIHQPLVARDETVWNDGSSSGAGGGGVSLNWPSPIWQSGSGVPGVTVGGDRQVPDVSATADQSRGITIFSAAKPPSPTATKENAPVNSVGWATIGGTSSAAPIWAAILADIASSGPAGTACGSLPVTPGGADLGFVTPYLYDVARLDYAGAFHDIVLGNNDAFGLEQGYSAAAGFDTASGLGSPVVVGTAGLRGLATDLCAVATGSDPVLPPRPVVASLSPAAGTSAGGNPVTIALAAPIPSGVSVRVEFGDTEALVTSASGANVIVTTPGATASPGAPTFAGVGPAAVTVIYSGHDGLASSFPTTQARYEYVDETSGASTTPVVTGVGPSAGAPGGGHLVIYGSGFGSSPDTVTVGGVDATDVVAVSDFEITATVPPLSGATACATGPGFDPANTCQSEVIVTNSGGASPTSTILPMVSGPIVFTPQGVVTQAPGSEIGPAATEYDYSPVPVITAITPNPAAFEGTSPVLITGAGFSLNTFEWVDFGPASSPSSEQLKILAITPTSIEIDPPLAPTSSGGALGGGVSVTTTAGVSNAVPFGYAGIPEVTGLSTHVGPSIGGTPVVISGRNFTGVTSVNFVSAVSVARFGESTVHVVHKLGAHRIKVVAPAGIVGPVDVEPCTPSGCATSRSPQDLFEFFSLAKPQVTSITPASGNASGGELVTINGNNLAGAISVHFGATATNAFGDANGFAPGAPNAIAVYAPPGAAESTVEVTVTTRSGSTAPSSRARYTYLPSGPSAPVDLSLAAGATGVVLRWSAPVSDGGSPITGYSIVAVGAGATFEEAVRGNVTSAIVNGLPLGRVTSVTVTATNASGRHGVPATFGSSTTTAPF